MKNRRTCSYRYVWQGIFLLASGLFALGIMSFGIKDNGGEETYIQTLSGSQLVAGASCEVKDDKFQNSSVDWNTITNLSVNDVITFEIRQDTSIYYYHKPFTATLYLTVQYYTSPSQVTPTELDNVKMEVRYDTTAGHPYPGVAMFKFKGAYRVKVTVDSLTSAELGTPLPAIFRLKNEIFIERKYQFDGTNSDVTTYSLNRSRLAIYWNPANYPGAEEYDLEWRPVDDSSAEAASIRSHFTSGGVIQIPDDTLNAWFYHHATRITTPAYDYTLNLPYNSGYLIYRVRGVQTDVNGVRETTTWCYKAVQGSDTGSTALPIPGMDDSLNWQYTGSFAEDGKRKEVVSYFDGTLRNRQSVTLNNSEDRSIVGETVYDDMGRPAAQVLPVPADDSVLQYFPSFNRNTAGTAPYNYTDLGQSSSCVTSAETMSTASGASQYYSSNNSLPKTNDYFFNKYIPDAGGYPFSVTAYTADNTGRISRQGGVGPVFQLGAGHETDYYYGKPQQSELDRLFGSEAGNAQHFLKNMVVDPNGQVSVRYINADGKTVATALAGTAPGDLHPLPSGGAETAVPDTEDMIQADNLSYNTGDYSITANASFTVPLNGNYAFAYQLDPLSLNTAYGPGETLRICSDCYYDLSITVTNDCGQVVHQETHDAGTVFDTLCSPPPLSGNFSLANLAIGSYNIAYKLQVSKAAVDFYDDRFVRVNTDLQTLADFTRRQIENAGYGSCFADCKTCEAALGTKDGFTARFTSLFAQYGITYDSGYQAWVGHLYDSLYAECEATKCTTQDSSVCYDNYRIMLQDVTPGGQYALYDSAYQLVDPDINILRLYTTTVFTDENGRLDSVPNSQGVLVPPSQLTLPEFIRNFKSSWADSLVTHHPEYCFYKWCLANEASKEFDDYVLNDLQTAAEADSAGMFDMNNYLKLFQSDPFFLATGTGYYLDSAMVDSLRYYSRILGMAYDSSAALPTAVTITTRDPSIQLYQASYAILFNQGFASEANDTFKALIVPGDQYKHGGYYDILGVADWMATCGQLGLPIDSCVVCQQCINPDLVWNTYKTLYLKLKAEMYQEAMADSQNPFFSNCKNCYIGTDGLSGGASSGNCGDCKAGYQPSSDGSYCYRDVAINATTDTLMACGVDEDVYTAYGSYLYTSYCIDGISQFSRSRLAPGNPFWIGDSLYANVSLSANGNCPANIGGLMMEKKSGASVSPDTTEPSGLRPMASLAANGPLNRCGIWACGSGAPIDQWIGVSAWVYFPESKTYYFGLGGDNEFRASIDGTDFIEKTDSENVENFRIWHIYPHYVSQGYHIVEADGFNISLYGALGMEVYNNTAAQLADAQDTSSLDILFSTNRFKGLPFSTDAGCPSGSVAYIEGSVAACRVITLPDTSQIPYVAEYAGKQRVYTDNINPDDALNGVQAADSTALIQQSRETADSMARANCADMADLWMANLSACTADTSLLGQIRRGLIAVAQKACDSLHPDGASTLPAGVTATADGRTYTSFDDVIKQVMGISAVNDSCTSDLITDPYPYDKQVQYTDLSVQKTDTAICSALATLQNEWAAGGSGGTFQSFLQQSLGDDYHLTEAQLTELEASCTTCHYLLKENLTLPAAFNGSTAPLSCSNVEGSLNAITVKYPDLTPDNPRYEPIVANYINHQYGYSLPYYVYQSFADSACPANSTAVLYNQAAAQDVATDTNSCVADAFSMAVNNAALAYQSYIDSVHQAFRNAFLTKCMNVQPALTMTDSLLEYQYTLYYYGQAGNLVKTVPPAGVHLLDRAGVDSVQLYRKYARSDCYLYSNYFTVTPPADSNAWFQFPPDSRFYTGSNPFTIEMWVKLNDFSDQGLASNYYHGSSDLLGLHDAGFSLRIHNGKLEFYLSGGAYTSSLLGHTVSLFEGDVRMASADIDNYMQTGQWTQIAVERTGDTTAAMYINGIPVAYTVTDKFPFNYGSGINPPAGAPLKIGAGVDSLNHTVGLHDAAIKQFRLYGRALGYGEIQQDLFSTCLTPSNSTGLAVWAPLNDTTLSDLAAGVTGQEAGDSAWFALNQSLWPIYPKHTLATYYEYNSLNEVTRQSSPDGGATQSWYDDLGRLFASQNSEQRHPVNGGSAGRYSYTKYDALGRIIEVGEKTGAADLNTISTQDSAAVNTWLASGTNDQVTFTRYDTTVTDNPQITPYQTNLRKRVAAVFSSDDGILNDYEAATHYSYDIEGNVKTLWQDIPALESIDTTGLKRIDYDYDIISGKVNEVTYEPNRGDQFFYKYTYDADNRVIALETSRDGLIWHNDASYRYYLHGPLARLELGTDKVQGVDYAYTLQGWLKGINGNNSSPLGGGQEGADMAQDGGTGIYAPFARDVYSLSLGYYNNDYTPIGGSGANAFSLSYTAPTNLDNTGNQLFNGNISNSTLSLSNLNGGLPVGYSYGYDQLNRITGMRQHTIANGASSWSNSNIINDYKEDVAYDANGNILKYLRNGTTQGGSPLGMDSLTYFYNANTNQLNTIHDSVPAGNYSVDIDNQNANNYAYDSIGNLMKDNSVGLSDIQWTVYGKIKQGTSSGITEQYSYDANNNRVIKTVQLGGITGKQYYIRDAQGNILAVYTYDGSTLKWAEQDLYGSSRVGLWSWNSTIPSKVMLPQSETDTLSDWYLLGSRDYELTNHLGNVLSVITDKKVGVSSGGSIVDYYKAEVLSQNDYYPFGMEEPGRSMSAIPYPYAFNGKRMENVELYISNQYDYGMRYYDARVGRFYSVDPLTGKYPYYTPYSFAGNKPIWAKDIDGGEEKYYQFDLNITNRGQIQVSNFAEIKEKRAGFSWVNTNYGYGPSFRIHHEPEGQFGPGAQYNVSLHIQNQQGKWEDRSLSYFIPRETLLERLGFKTQKEDTREGGIIFSSSQPFAGRDNSLNPTAKHPDRYIVPIDEIISGFDAANAAAEKSPDNLIELFKRLVTAYGLGQDVGEHAIEPIKRKVEQALPDVNDTMPNSAVVNGKIVPGLIIKRGGKFTDEDTGINNKENK